MARPPAYSTQFIVYLDATPNFEYDVPTGYVAVLRDFTAYADVSASFAYVTIQDSAAAPAVKVAQLELAGVATYGQWTGRVVCPGGGIIGLTVGSLVAGLNIYVGGYLLQA